jgi:hypothetical protein
VLVGQFLEGGQEGRERDPDIPLPLLAGGRELEDFLREEAEVQLPPTFPFPFPFAVGLRLAVAIALLLLSVATSPFRSQLIPKLLLGEV